MASTPATLNIAALAGATTLANGLTNVLLATPQNVQGYQPQNTDTVNGLVSLITQPPGIIFDYEGEQSMDMDSDITDHFIGNNTALQDQIALRPIIINTHGFIGELNNVPPPILAALQQAANTLSDVGSYLPGLSVTAQIAYDQAFAAYQLAASAVSAGVAAYSSLLGNETQNAQQTIFSQLYGYRQNRTLFTVQTPWAIFKNMAILKLHPVQDETTRTITDFQVSFKQINIASTALLGGVLQSVGRAATQSSSLTSQGTGSLSPGPTVGQGLSKMGAL